MSGAFSIESSHHADEATERRKDCQDLNGESTGSHQLNRCNSSGRAGQQQDDLHWSNDVLLLVAESIRPPRTSLKYWTSMNADRPAG